MNFLLDNPVRALIAGLVVAGLMLAAWLLTGPVDSYGLISVLLRFVHVVAAMAWIGLIFFVNFVQLPAFEEADEVARSAIANWIVPRVAAGFRHASHLTLLSGALLLISTGYLLGEWFFSSSIYIPPQRTATLTAGALGGIVIWGVRELCHLAEPQDRTWTGGRRCGCEGPGATDRKALCAARISSWRCP